MINLFPFLFVFFWSSAFVSGQIIVQSASPFASLSFRFVIVAFGFLLFALSFREKIVVKNSLVLQSGITGIFFHGFYLGGVFFSYSIGLSATLSTLIVGLQPVLTNILSGPILREKVTSKGGTTDAAIKSLISSDKFYKILNRAINQARDRSKKLN